MYTNKLISKKKKIEKTPTESSDEENANSNETVYRQNNHIFFYCNVNTNNILQLNKHIMNINREFHIIKSRIDNDNNITLRHDTFKIYLHINSPGGYITDALAGVDTIINSKFPITSIIEGSVASAATFLSIVCSKRQITKHSIMLIHQLSSGYWGTYEQILDDFKNCTYLQKTVKKLYMEYTNGKLDKDKLDAYLKRDIYWSAKKCKKLGLVDEII